MTDAQLERELRDIRDLIGATFCAIVGGGEEKQRNWLVAARDSEFFRRYMGGVGRAHPFWGNDPEIPPRAQELLRDHSAKGSRPPLGGLLNLEEAAVAGRATVTAIPGIGPKTMEAIDAALVKHELEWSDGGES